VAGGGRFLTHRLWGAARSLILVIAPVGMGITLIADIVGTEKS